MKLRRANPHPDAHWTLSCLLKGSSTQGSSRQHVSSPYSIPASSFARLAECVTMARCRAPRSAPRMSCTMRPPEYRWNVGNALQAFQIENWSLTVSQAAPGKQ